MGFKLGMESRLNPFLKIQTCTPNAHSLSQPNDMDCRGTSPSPPVRLPWVLDIYYLFTDIFRRCQQYTPLIQIPGYNQTNGTIHNGKRFGKADSYVTTICISVVYNTVVNNTYSWLDYLQAQSRTDHMCGGGTDSLSDKWRVEQETRPTFWTNFSKFPLRKYFSSHIACVMPYNPGGEQYFWVSYLKSR